MKTNEFDNVVRCVQDHEFNAPIAVVIGRMRNVVARTPHGDLMVCTFRLSEGETLPTKIISHLYSKVAEIHKANQQIKAVTFYLYGVIGDYVRYGLGFDFHAQQTVELTVP